MGNLFSSPEPEPIGNHENTPLLKNRSRPSTVTTTTLVKPQLVKTTPIAKNRPVAKPAPAPKLVKSTTQPPVRPATKLVKPTAQPPAKPIVASAPAKPIVAYAPAKPIAHTPVKPTTKPTTIPYPTAPTKSFNAKSEDNLDQLPAVILPYVALSFMAYLYPTYFYLGLAEYDILKRGINLAQKVPVNSNSLKRLPEYISRDGILSFESRKDITTKFNNLFKILSEKSNQLPDRLQPGLLAPKYDYTALMEKMTKFAPTKSGWGELLRLSQSGLNTKHASIYIHTSDDLTCYVVADWSDINQPEVSVVFRGTRSLQNAITDTKGALMKKTIERYCDPNHPLNPDNNVNPRVFGDALNMEEEVLNTILFSIIYAKSLIPSKPKKVQLTITGHSLGGCLANIFGLLIGKTIEMEAAGDLPAIITPEINVPIRVVAVSSPRSFNKAAATLYDGMAHLSDASKKSGKKQIIEHINMCTRGDQVPNVPLQATGFYHPGDYNLEGNKQGEKVASSTILKPSNIRSEAAPGIGAKTKTLNTKNTYHQFKPSITPTSTAHMTVAGLKLPLGRAAIGFKAGSDISIKKGCKVSVIHNSVTTSYVFPFSEDMRFMTFEDFKKMVVRNLHEDHNLKKTAKGIITYPTANPVVNPGKLARSVQRLGNVKVLNQGICKTKRMKIGGKKKTIKRRK